MQLIARYRNSGFEAVADGIIDFFDKRTDLHTRGISFNSSAEETKISTDISLSDISLNITSACLIRSILSPFTNAFSLYLLILFLKIENTLSIPFISGVYGGLNIYGIFSCSK